MTSQTRETDDLWKRYKLHNDQTARVCLIELYAPLVKYVAGRVAVNLPRNVDEGDLVGYGSLGLLDAVQRFDPARGVKFETYAIARIRGSMIDGLRSMDWVPVSVRQRNRALEGIVRDLENRLGRSATDAEIAEEAGMTVTEYHERLRDMAGSSILSLEDVLGGYDDPDSRKGEVRDDKAPDPADEAVWSSRKDVLASAIDNLPEREKLVVILYYFEGLTVKEISQILKVSPSRVSQLHTKAVIRLRGFMAGERR